VTVEDFKQELGEILSKLDDLSDIDIDVEGLSNYKRESVWLAQIRIEDIAFKLKELIVDIRTF